MAILGRGLAGMGGECLEKGVVGAVTGLFCHRLQGQVGVFHKVLAPFQLGLNQLFLEGNAVIFFDQPPGLADADAQANGKLVQGGLLQGEVIEKAVQNGYVKYLREIVTGLVGVGGGWGNREPLRQVSGGDVQNGTQQLGIEQLQGGVHRGLIQRLLQGALLTKLIEQHQQLILPTQKDRGGQLVTQLGIEGGVLLVGWENGELQGVQHGVL